MKSLKVSFLARKKRYGKWQKLELKNISEKDSPERISNGCKELAQEYFESDYVETQNISKAK